MMSGIVVIAIKAKQFRTRESIKDRFVTTFITIVKDPDQQVPGAHFIVHSGAPAILILRTGVFYEDILLSKNACMF